MSNRFYKKNFIFQAVRYEEWQRGRCISHGPISTKIIAEVVYNNIHFELDDIGDIRMLTSFDFEILDEGYSILPDRIQYVHGTNDFNPVVPMICQLFNDGFDMEYVRFAMTNPDRLVEFYGRLIKLNQPSTGEQSARYVSNEVSAENILDQLRGYGMYNIDAIMERAVDLYNDNSEIKTLFNAKAIVECLKLFVKVYQLDKSKYEKEGRTSALKPKILMFLALCNYKICNVNRAYCLAKQGLDAVDKAIEDSIFIGIPRSTYGADTLQKLIDIIEKDSFNEVENEDDYYVIDPEEVDTARYEEIRSGIEGDSCKPSRQQIKDLIKTISKYKSLISEVGKTMEDGWNAFQANLFLETLKIPLCLAWQGYKYGWHTDFCEEGDSLLPFMMFEVDLKSNTQKLIDVLKNESSLSILFGNDSSIPNSLISIYTRFLEDIDNGTIKL